MKYLLLIFALLAFIHSTGQNPHPKDAVYTPLKDQCDIKFDKTKVKNSASTDSTLILYSDKGKLRFPKEDFKRNLQQRDKKYNFTATTLRKDSLVLFLFNHDILNYDNLQRAASEDKTAVSQYGDTSKITIPADCSAIKLYDIVWRADTLKKTKTFIFDISFIFENNPYSIYHFYLTVETDKKIPGVRLIRSTIPKLKCLRYTGFEI